MNSIAGRLSGLQRLGLFGGMILAVLVVAGIFGMAGLSLREEAYYEPGKPLPSREDCFYEKLSRFQNINRQIIAQAASDCELEVQSLEGHEQRRQEWMQRQAERARQRAAEPPPVAVEETPQEPDRVRRVWR